MVDLLTLKSAHELLQNHGAISEYAKSGQNSTEIKKIKSSLYTLDTMVWYNNHLTL
jgi:hypothetical protein